MAPTEAPPTRLLPQSLDAEKSVLGASLLSEHALSSALDLLSAGDFSREAHRLIFAAMQHLASAGSVVDVVTVMEAIPPDRRTLVGGVAYMASLCEGVPRSLHVDHYARIVREKARLRALIQASGDLQDAAYRANGDAAAVLASAPSRIADAVGPDPVESSLVTAADIAAKASRVLEDLYRRRELVSGLATGLRELDEQTTGLQPANLSIVGARPSVGKTALACGTCAAVAKETGVLFLSLEMSALEIAMRLICAIGRVDLRRLRSGYLSNDEIGNLAKAISEISRLHLLVDDTGSLTPSGVAARVKRAQDHFGERGLSLVVIDYLQLLTEPGHENRNLELAAISRQLKALAKSANVHVMALAQLNRGATRRTDRRPQLSDLRDSGALEQDADLVLLLHREDMLDGTEQGIVELTIAKQRNGPTGSIKLAFIKEYTRFDNLEWKPAEDGAVHEPASTSRDQWWNK